jgi:hypothetical protein
MKLAMEDLSVSQLLYIVLERALAEEIAAMQRQQEENRALDAITEMFGVTWIPQDDQSDQYGGTSDSQDNAPDEFEEEWVLV